MIDSTKVALVSIQGLPAKYGAFEQTADQLVRHSVSKGEKLEFFVGCSKDLSSESYDVPMVRRRFFLRRKGIGVLLYGLKTVFWAILRGCKVFIFFGYAMAPIFPLLRFFGFRVICNVDGIEWRREKWGRLAKNYFKFCEALVAKTDVSLIFDAKGIARYYEMTHRRKGHQIYYGTEEFLKEKDESCYTFSFDTARRFAIVVMRMEPENNILAIVKGFSNYKGTCKLVLVGPSTDYFERTIQPLIAIDKRILYLGSIYDRRKLMYLRSKATCYIHGHSVGGTNPTLVEAVSLKRPILAYSSIFNREVLKENGLYFANFLELSVLLEKEQYLKILPVPLGIEYSWSFVVAEYIKLIKNEKELNYE